MIRNRKGFEFSFAWIFAMLVGAAILFLAIYAAMQFVDTGRHVLDTTTAQELSILLEPMETGVAEGSVDIATLRDVTRINNDCYEGRFGRHEISISTKQGVGGDWQRPGESISVRNKYVFSNSTIETGDERKVFLFSKPLDLPWKVSPLIFATTENYCFRDPPRMVENDIQGLNIQNLKIYEGGNCSIDDIHVCFEGGSDCDMTVHMKDEENNVGIVNKNGERVTYVGNLIYGAIFADNETYECNVNRLMFRLIQQANLYASESNFLKGRGKCDPISANRIRTLTTIVSGVESSEGLPNIISQVNSLNEQNRAAECRLWYRG